MMEDESIKVLEHGVRSGYPVLLFVSWQLPHTSLQPMKMFAGKYLDIKSV